MCTKICLVHLLSSVGTWLKCNYIRYEDVREKIDT